MSAIPPFLYADANQARRAFAEAWLTGDGLRDSAEVGRAIENLEDTAEEIATAASCLGDRHQAATTPEQWQPIICEAALQYWHEWRSA
ncbi:hypothetical protein [Halorhodospira halophila]|uniref:hypothetical protein n=1 Tax=Halorhodospira halophila TaxID=1053 RepID=UPI001914C80F|nr:hypothetical protein [Halorhodospira halophila]MBK5942751.1 hypothetical protein [Halorhodospira halophila]